MNRMNCRNSTLHCKLVVGKMQQLALVGPDAVGDGEQKGEIETKGLWDTILQPITAVIETSVHRLHCSCTYEVLFREALMGA